MLVNTLYFINSLFFNFCIAFYLMSALQWYSYKFKRVFFHYHKPLWHLYFLFIPYFLFLAFPLYLSLIQISNNNERRCMQLLLHVFDCSLVNGS
ncbi:hypothetical protein ACISMU_05315, partial [Campylobacter jejuni]